MRIACADGTAADVYLTAKGPSKSTVAVQHRKLPSVDAAAEAKVLWAARLEALATLVSEGKHEQRGESPLGDPPR